MIPWRSFVSASASLAGASYVYFRPSAHCKGWVAVCVFEQSVLASKFARRWAMRLPASCGGVLCRKRGNLWLVSVPVQP
ncbi:MAG: hypothetical protein QXU75_05470 [Candidatus Methanomethylicaceae archaeon]